MTVESCIPIIPSANLEKSLNQRAGTALKPEGYEGIRLYWGPKDIWWTRLHWQSLPVEPAMPSDVIIVVS